MTSKEFKTFRKKLEKTQRQMAHLLGVSIKAVHSYEQGWRSVPVHVERQIFFLVSRLKKNIHDKKPCWDRKACPTEKKKLCPAWEFQAGLRLQPAPPFRLKIYFSRQLYRRGLPEWYATDFIGLLIYVQR